MTTEELKSVLPGLFPSATVEEGGEWATMNLGAGELHAAAIRLRNDSGFYCDFLFCLTCIDWKTHLTMVYHLSATTHRHTIVIKVKLDRANPFIDTVCDIWR